LPKQLPRTTPSVIKVLHVDDEEYQLDTVRHFLGQLDDSFNFTSVSSTQLAFKQLEENQFDCIVTDLKMPGMNGLEFAKAIRGKVSAPIIIYTGQGSEEVAEAAFSIGIDDYIRKEIDPSHYHLLAKRIKAAVEQRRTEQLYLHVVEDTRDAIAIASDGVIVFANKALSDMLGLNDPKELIGKSPMNFVESQNRANLKRNMDDRLQQFPLTRINEYEVLRRDGSLISIETSTSVIEYNGKDSLLVFIRDITGRKEMERAIQKSEALFRTLVSMAPDGIATMNMRGVITFINPSFSKLTGFESDEIIGKNFLNIGTLRMKDLPNFVSLFAHFVVKEGRLDRPIEYTFKRKDGSEGFAEAQARFIEVEGNQKEIFIIARDISERKKIEEELRSYSKELEKRVLERSQTLIDSEKLIAAGRVASMVGHDLRGPLNTIKNATYLMETKPETTKEMLRIINSAVDMSVKMLDELRNQTRESPLELEEVDLAELVDEAVKESIPPPKIHIQSRVEGFVSVKIDRTKMRRVLDNLIRNGCDAMPSGGVLLITGSDEGNDVVITVQDQGEGIPETVKANLFKPFMTTKENGTGLGLPFCKRVIDAHGGQISFASSQGKGTTFTIRLPRQRGMLSLGEQLFAAPESK